MTIAGDIQKLNLGAVVEMYALDLTPMGGSLLRFHPGVNFNNSNLVWQGNTYTRYPVQAEGFEFSSKGQLPRPTLRVSNVGSALTAYIALYGDLVGAPLTRKRTFVKYLDAVNFVGSVNATADPTAYFPDDVYYIDRKANENKNFIEFELASVLDLAGVKLPRRQIIQNICPWLYRGSECGYAGGAVAKADDTPTATLGEDVCGKRLPSCKLRFGSTAELPFGGFPAAGLTRV